MLAICQDWLIIPVDENPSQTHRVASWWDQDAHVLKSGKIGAGLLLRRLQKGEILAMPHSCPIQISYKAWLKINITWRVISYIAYDAKVILEVFSKKSKETPKYAIENSKKHLKEYLS